MIVIDYCQLPGFHDGREKVMVRLRLFGVVQEPYITISKDEWLGVCQGIKPVPSLWQINERTLEEW